MNLRYFCLLLLVLISTLSAHAQTIGPERVLIRNVVLIDPKEIVDDKLVNILIKKNKLDLVTEDKVSSSDADLLINAKKGFILGRLEIGKQPSFIIVREDPRINFEVIKDTSIHSIVVVDDGVVVKNWIPPVVNDEPEEEPKKSGWLAYTPPPFMIPLNYLNPAKWNQFSTKPVNGIFTSLLLLDRLSLESQNEGAEEQFPDLNLYNGGAIRAFRMGFVGTLNFENPWFYTVFIATNAFNKGYKSQGQDSILFYDYRLDIPFLKNSVMSIGKQKAPISMDRLSVGHLMINQERAAVSDAFLPSRNTGVVWNGSSPEKYCSWAFGVFNNWLEDGESFDETDTVYAGRLAWAPLVSEDESNLLHFGIAYRYSNAVEGFQFTSKPEFNQAPIFVDTELHNADKVETYNLELAWRRGPTTLSSEYTQVKVDNQNLGHPTFDGYFVTAGWILTGEMRDYKNKSGIFSGLAVAKSVYQDGKGALELYTRYSHIDTDDGAIDGGEMQIATLGLNWWLTQFFSMNISYRYIWNEIGGVKAESTGLMARLILVLE